MARERAEVYSTALAIVNLLYVWGQQRKGSS